MLSDSRDHGNNNDTMNSFLAIIPKLTVGRFFGPGNGSPMATKVVVVVGVVGVGVRVLVVVIRCSRY